jgi:molecular chaperone GrpE
LRADIHEDRDDTPQTEADSSGSEGAAEAENDDAAGPEETTSPAPDATAIDYKDRWLRAEAELQNVRRRARREIEDVRRAAEEAVLLDLVALLDDLERALQAATASGGAPAWIEGVALVLQKGREYLERQGVSTVDPVGQPFDPTFHEAILEVDAPEGVASGHVVQVVQKGYRRGARALRAARVVVARLPISGR